MQALVIALGVFAAIPTVLAGAKTTACNANNCARDVTGTREGKLPLLEVRKTDCANFMTATVYATPTATQQPNVVYNRKMKRDPVTVKGQTVPSYIKQCDGNTVSYASACSCWGYTATTVTVTTPTTTVEPPVAN
ncbi:hypothetical protein RB595_009369 [Gaeumannomyces hyphopodioides]